MSQDEGERRHLTVLFCDLAGSTALSRQLDPEVLRDLLRVYQGISASAISQFEGFTAQFLGDGVLAYFGYPQAHEDDAQRAVRAGLQILSEMQTVTTPQGDPLRVRVGIASGMVVVGHTLESGTGTEHGVVGETPNLAARLQGLAPPNGIIVSESTRRLLGGSFELAQSGPKAAKGFDESVVVYQVLGEKQVVLRFDAVRDENQSRFVGRDGEVGLLQTAWHEVGLGHGKGLLFTGEPGIGKSRLLEHFSAQLDEQTSTTMRFQCSPYHTNTEFYPIISNLRYAARLQANEPAATQIQKLASLFSQDKPPSSRDVALLAEFLGIKETTATAIDLPAEQRKYALFELLWARLVSLAEHSPLLAIFEDLHWADPSSLDFIGYCATRFQESAILFALTARPEFSTPGWISGFFPEHILSGLRQEERFALVRNLSKGQLCGELVETIVLRTDGIPLFVEELTRGLQESQQLSAAPGLSRGVPDTLQDLLMERLDRLGPAREVAQVASAIGREFDPELLFVVAGQSKDQLQAHLEELLASELITGGAQGSLYRFKHALVQEAAHNSILKRRCRELHQRIADTLEHNFKELAEREPELLAQHYDQAERPEQALIYYRRAADNAVGFANVEAASNYKAALRCLSSLPGLSNHQEIEMELRAGLGVALTATLGYANVEVEQNFVRAQQLSAGDPGSDTRFGVLRGLWNCHFDRGDFQNATKIVNELRELSLLRDEDQRRPYVDRAAGSLALYMGRVQEADRFLSRACDTTAGPQWHTNLRNWVDDPNMVAHAYQGWANILSGRLDEGLSNSLEATKVASRTGHPLSLGFATGCLNFSQAILGEFKPLIASAEENLEFCQRQALPFWYAWIQVLYGYAKVFQQGDRAGIDLMAAGMAGWRATGAILHIPTQSCLFMGACIHLGLTDRARAAGSDGLEAAAHYGENMMLAELQTKHGHLAFMEGNREAAADWYAKAANTAREQGAVLWLVKALTELVKIGSGTVHTDALAELRRCRTRISGAENLQSLVKTDGLTRPH